MSTYVNNPFTTAGNKERDMLTRLYAKINIPAHNYTFTNSTGFAPVDGFFKTSKLSGVVEAKVRNDSSTRYPDHMIEKKKYDELVNYYNNGFDPFYINFFTDGVAIVYNLKKRIEQNSIHWFNQHCKKTTAVQGNYVPKLIGNLKYDETLGDKMTTL